MSDELILRIALGAFASVVVAYVALNHWRQLLRVSISVASIAVVLALSAVVALGIVSDERLVASFTPLAALCVAWLAALIVYRVIEGHIPDLTSLLAGEPPWDEPELRRRRAATRFVMLVVIAAVFGGTLAAAASLLNALPW